MKLYSRPLSPFAARCRIQLYAKGLPFELVPVPMPNPEAFRALNPIGKVPALEIDGEVIPESQVICEYLEARFPEPPLLPLEPGARARAQLLSRIVDLYLLPLVDPLADQLDPATRDDNRLRQQLADIDRCLDQLETLLSPGPLAVGVDLTLADCALAPAFFLLTRALSVLEQSPFDSRPKLKAWWAAVEKLPPVERVHQEMERGLQNFRPRRGSPRQMSPPPGEEALPGQFLTKYLCQKLVPRMLAASERGTFGGERIFAVIMFVDIHGYSTLAERLDPERVMEILNRNLGCIVEAIFAHDGAVLQLLGDGALVAFGVHETRPDDPQRAARAALEVHARLRTLQAGVPDAEQVSVAIGLDCGEVVCGNIGHEQRLEFGLVGDTMNVAARVQSMARSGETLLTSNLADLLGAGFQVEPVEETMVKGRSQPVHVRRLISADAPAPEAGWEI